MEFIDWLKEPKTENLLLNKSDKLIQLYDSYLLYIKSKSDINLDKNYLIDFFLFIENETNISMYFNDRKFKNCADFFFNFDGSFKEAVKKYQRGLNIIILKPLIESKPELFI